MKREWYGRMLLGAVLVGVVAGLFFWVLPSPPPFSRLADGTEITLLAVTHGATNILFPGGIRDRLINRFAPNGVHWGPIKIAPVTPIVDFWGNGKGAPAFPNRAVIWLGHSGPSNGPPFAIPNTAWFSEIRATLADQNGEEWELRSGMQSSRSTTIRGINWVTHWDFTSFPRRGRTLRFRLYERNKLDGWDTLADFKLPNPCPGPFPIWNPSSLPATQKSGGLEVALVGLVSGRKALPYHLGERPFTKATFEVKENGQVTEAWRPDQMESSDATGNEPMAPMVDMQAPDGQVTYEIQGVSLSPTEAWRLKTRFSKDGELIWTSPRLVMEAGALAKVNLTTNIQPYKITLECEQTPFHNTIRAKLDPLPQETRLCFPEFVDNLGVPVTYESGWIGDAGFDAQWKIPVVAEWIQLRLRLAQTRTFEFVAQPIPVLGKN